MCKVIYDFSVMSLFIYLFILFVPDMKQVENCALLSLITEVKSILIL